MIVFLVAVVHVWIDRMLGPKPPPSKGRNLVGGNREQDFWPLRKGQCWF